MTPAGFECTVRALRVCKPMTRQAWAEFENPMWIEFDPERRLVERCQKLPNASIRAEEYTAPSEDILATDWIVYEQ